MQEETTAKWHVETALRSKVGFPFRTRPHAEALPAGTGQGRLRVGASGKGGAAGHSPCCCGARRGALQALFLQHQAQCSGPPGPGRVSIGSVTFLSTTACDRQRETCPGELQELGHGCEPMVQA